MQFLDSCIRIVLRTDSFFVRNADELQTVLQEDADWIESQQASLKESNDFKAQTILQKAA
jgi:hypothetical protein